MSGARRLWLWVAPALVVLLASAAEARSVPPQRLTPAAAAHCGFADEAAVPPGVSPHSLVSEGLGEDLCVILVPPPGGVVPDHPYPLIVLLHGLGAKPAAWLSSADIKTVAHAAMQDGALPPAWIAIPEGRNGYWTDWHDGRHPWTRWIVDEVVPAIRAQHLIVPGSSRVAIAGISMGGFGALSIALRHPEVFGAAAGLSATDMRLAVDAQPKRKTYTQVYGAPPDPTRIAATNPVDLVRGGAGRGQRFVVIHGTAEPPKFSVGGTQLVAAMREAGIDVRARAVKGGTHSFKNTWSIESQRFWLGGVGRAWGASPR